MSKTSCDLAISGFQDKNVKIDISGLPKDTRILGNELLIDIFDNILNNAIKYNDNEKEVKVEVNILKIQEDDSQIRPKSNRNLRVARNSALQIEHLHEWEKDCQFMKNPRHFFINFSKLLKN